MGNPCRIPPGRLEEVMAYLPIIPPGLWSAYQSSGTWPQGIQKGLTETADCPWVDSMAQVRYGAVMLHDRTVVRILFRGAFPWGWYRGIMPIGDTDTPPPPPRPRDPIRTMQMFRPDTVGRLLELPTLDVMGFDPPEETSPVEQESGCEIIPVPTIDVLVPFPMATGYMPWPSADRTRNQPRPTRVGEFGRMVIRVPGSDHPMFSTGIAIWYICREFLSSMGAINFNAWDAARATSLPFASQVDPITWNHGREIATPRTWCGNDTANPVLQEVLYQWWTRDLGATHMQCPRNFFPRTPQHVAAGIAGQMQPRRWHFGGDRPAAYSGNSFDYCEERMTIGAQGGIDPGYGQIYPRTYDAEGRPHDATAPEAPFGYRDQWRGRYRMGLNLWRGPAPGSLR